MKSFSEIDTVSKRATRAIGFSWGVAEEVGKNIQLLEMFGLPGIKNLNEYFKIYKTKKFQNISLIGKSNTSKISYCPITTGLNFLDQATIMEELNEIYFENIGYPILLIPFLSRASEIIGKKIFIKIDKLEFLLNFNQSIYSNYYHEKILQNANKVSIKFFENKNLFSEKDWQEIYSLSENIFVEESDELKIKGAGAGLLDND